VFGHIQLFGFGLILPVILWILIRAMSEESEVELVDLISDYGYAQSVFMFIMVLSMIHSDVKT